MPEGMTVNPSSGAGLSACSEAQFAEEQAPPPTAQAKAEGHGCPNSSKLATVKIKTPSISEEVTGSAYLAEPAPRSEAGKNPFNSLLALYLIARAGDRGVLVKAPGLVSLNQETGRITTTFGPTPEFDEGHVAASPGLPPLPASDIKFEFNQGANAPLVTPPTCGDYTVTAELTPWSTLQAATLPGGGEAFSEGNPLDPSIPPFAIFANCPSGNVPPFNPGVTAYPLHGNAGAYSPLYLKISRQDGEQEITGFSTAFPPGLTGNLSGVAQCSEAQVQQARGQTGVEAETSPACPAGSEIGYSIAEAGVGGVLAQNPGKIYLGGPLRRRAVLGRVRDRGARRPVRPRHRRDPLPARHQPGNRRRDDPREPGGCDPAHHQRDRRARPQHPRLRQPQRLHAQPNELQPEHALSDRARRRPERATA